MTDKIKKDSFVLHKDSLKILDQMTNEQAGMFIKAIAEYQNTGKAPKCEMWLSMILALFINQFERDNEKYEKIVERNKNNGKNGGRPKTQPNPENPVGSLETENNPHEPKKPDNDNVPDNVSDIDINKKNIKKENDRSVSNESSVTEKIDYQELFNKFWSEYPNKTGSKKEAEKSFIKALSKTKEPLVLSEKINKALMSYKEYLKAHSWLHVSHASTWLNKERWNDEYSLENTQNNTNSYQNEQSHQTTQNHAQKAPLNDDKNSDDYFAYRFNEDIASAFSYKECIELTESIENAKPQLKKVARTMALIEWLKTKPDHELTANIKKEVIEICEKIYIVFIQNNIKENKNTKWKVLLDLLYN